MAITHPRAAGAARARGWVAPAARAGYLTKGVLYVLVGVLALQTVLGAPGEGELGGPGAAVDTIGEQPFGKVLLTLVGIGLFAYAAWRLVQAILDPEGSARDGSKAIAKRIGWAISGVIHASLGVAALQIAMGERASADRGAQSWIGEVLGMPAGDAILVTAGAAVVLFALYEIYRAWTTDFTRQLQITRMSPTERRWAIRSGRFGLFARGVVFLIIGSGIIQAALGAAPGEAKDIGGALREIAGQPSGAALLTVVALGLLAYGVFQVVEAKYRRIPVRV